MLHSTMSNNNGSRGGALHLSGSDDIIISSCNFSSNVASHFGGAVAISSCSNMVMEASALEFNRAGSGENEDEGTGGAADFDSVSGLVLRELRVANNAALRTGGGFHLTSCDDFAVVASVFEANSASTGAGSAVWISQSKSSNISGNTFTLNQALEGSGAAYWLYSSDQMPSEPLGLQHENTFLNNSARFSADFSSSAINLVIAATTTPARKLLAESAFVILVVNDYSTTFLPVMSAYQYDYYNQIAQGECVIITAETDSVLNDCGDFERFRGSLTKETIDGVAAFDGLDAVCKPGGVMRIEFAAEVSGTYRNESLHVFFRNCLDGEFLNSGVCTECPPGSYSFKYSAVKGCEIGCPRGAKSCQGSEIVVESGKWRMGNNTAEIIACPFGEEACLGGSMTGESCAEGYTGPLCAVCEDGYYLQSSTSKCSVCPDSGLSPGAIALIVLVGVGVIVGILFAAGDGLFTDVIANVSFFGCWIYVYQKLFPKAQDWDNEQLEVMKERIESMTKIYVSLIQIVSALPFVLDISFPVNFESFISFGSILNLNLFNEIALRCEHDYDHMDFLLMITLIPIGLTILSITVYWAHYLVLWSKNRSDKCLSQLYVTYLRMFLVFSFLALPGICIFIFKTFSCKDLDKYDAFPEDNIYMQADYSVSCTSDRYYWGRNYAIGMIFIYPIGVPLFYFLLLWTNRDDIKSRKSPGFSQDQRDGILPLRFLYDSYNPKYWYWYVCKHFLRYMSIIIICWLQGDHRDLPAHLTDRRVGTCKPRLGFADRIGDFVVTAFH
jgi:hypothetical protein